jgi:HK97 family phage major capsid protein
MSFAQIQKLRQERAAILPKMRAIDEKAKTEGRPLNTEERSEFESLEKDFTAKGTEIERLEGDQKKDEERQSRMRGYEDEMRRTPGRKTEATPTDRRDDHRGGDDDGNPRRARTFRSAGELVVRAGNRVVRAREGSALAYTATDEYREAFGEYLRNGRADRDILTRGQTVQAQQEGGYLQVPMQFIAELLADVDDAVVMRGLARVLPPISATSVGAPRRTAKLSSAAWGTELSEPTTDTSLKFGLREIAPHYMTMGAEISRALLYGSNLDVESIVRAELVRDAGELEEKAFLTGDGVNKPLGIFTASGFGVSTGRDVSTGNTTTSPTADGLTQAFFTLKDQYRGRSSWLMHRDAITKVMLLKDGNGQYLFRLAAGADRPDTLFNRPVVSSEFAPNTFTTGQYVGVVGDFSNYWIVDGTEVQLQKLVETKAKSNRDEFIGRRKVDGAPVIEEAFVRVKLG